jgi:succinate dehydrogenase / fumarate reductase membrane anchor subunit
LRESIIWVLHGVTGLLIIIFGSIHLLSSIFGYTNPFPALIIEALLIVGLYHGMNGLRVIFLEIKQDGYWERLINWSVIIFGFLILIYGTSTVLDLFT